MDFGTIRRCKPFVRIMLGGFGGGVLELLQVFSDVVGHGDVDVVFWVFPIDGHSAVIAARWVDGDGLMLSDRIKDVGGIVGGEELDTKVFYSEGEGGGKGRMVPKSRSIFHRGVPMGLEVAYMVFVGDDAGFLEPIYPISDINVDVSAWVRDVEDGVFNNHLVWNVLDMDPHVLGVGHWVIEVVVYDICGDVAVPFSGVGDDRVKVDLEV